MIRTIYMPHFQHMTRRQAKNNTVINLCGFVSREVNTPLFNNQSHYAKPVTITNKRDPPTRLMDLRFQIE